MSGLVNQRSGTLGVPQLLSEQPDVPGQAVGVRGQGRVPVVTSDETGPVDDHEDRIELDTATGGFVEHPEALTDHVPACALIASCPTPDLTVGARPEGGLLKHYGIGSVEGYRHLPELGPAEIDAASHPLTDLAHRLIDRRTLFAAVGRKERVQGDLTPPILGCQRLACLVDEGEARSDPDPGKDLNGLEDSEGHHAEDDNETEGDEPLEDWPHTTHRLIVVTRALLLSAILLLTVACLPGAELSQGPGILGTYVVNGVDPNGTEYTGRMSIAEGAAPGEVAIEWVVTGAIIHGEGRVDGDTLTVDWTITDSPRGASTGTAEYEILDDGRLVGTRTVDGIDQSGTEEIFPEP